MIIKALLIGESCISRTYIYKGVDMLSYNYYEEHAEYLRAALTTDIIEFHHLPRHLVDSGFPESAEQLMDLYDAVIISDCGANMFLLPAKTFVQYKPTPNKLEILRDYAEMGGGLCMIGGYMSFMGIEGKGRYNATSVEEALPVNFLTYDDRVELPQSVRIPLSGRHEIFEGVPALLPPIFGYNRAVAKKYAMVALECNGDPIIAMADYGKGRTMAYAMDCAPHWCPKEFAESDTYKRLWQNIIKWLTKH